MILNRNRNVLILCIGLLFCLGLVPGNVPAAAKTCVQPKSEAEIRSLLQKWRDQIRPGLPGQEVKLVEKAASGLPLDLPSGQLSATFEDSETKTDIRIGLNAQRRDMAYALAGFGYTFLGGNFAGQEKMKDIGLWCFLEAALLKMISPHLLNVGFHLNERGAYDDALSILCYAAALNPNLPAVHNNLAYNLAAKGNFKAAVDEAAQALSLDPEKDSYRRRLKYYGQKAGIKVDNLVTKSGAPPAGQMPYSQAFSELVSLITQKYQSFQIDFFGMQLQRLYGQCFSGAPGSADAAWSAQLMAIDQQAESCRKACAPKGILPAGLSRCLCQCALVATRSTYAATLQYYRECVRILQPWIDAASKANDQLNMELGGKIEARQKAFRSGEFNFLEAYLDRAYFGMADNIDEVKAKLDGVYKTVVDQWKDLQSQIRECSARSSGEDLGNPEDYFGKRPPRLKRVVRDSDKPWNIWFFFGELKLYPDDTAKLSLGRPGLASVKLKFNFKTYDFGAGVGLGLNVGKLLGPGGSAFNQLFKFEFYAMTDTQKGLHYGLETGVRTKKYGILSMGDQVVTLEN